MKYPSMILLSVNMKFSDNSKMANILWQALPRGLALFLGGFSLLNLLGRFRSIRADENLWWIDLRWLPSTLANALLLLSTFGLLAFALRPSRSAWQRNLTLSCAGGLAA